MIEEQEPLKVPKTPNPYTLKVWQAVGIVVSVVVAILIIRVAFNVLLMALAGSMIAVYFHGLGGLIQRKTKLRRKFAMIIAVALTFMVITGLLWFIGAKVQAQVTQLSNTLPHTINSAKDKLAQTPIGRKLLEYSSGDNTKKLVDTVTSFFNTSFGVIGDLYIIMFLGIFFTVNPTMYKDGLLLLVPHEKKLLGIHILERISQSLKGWLKGMMISMALVFTLVTVGLSIVGMPVTMVLGLITGLLEIVPNLGSVIAMVPGVLIAFTISTNTAVGVSLIYIASQTIVSNIVTPLIQKRMINLPPALTLISQLIMGTMSGALGIILAVPLLSILVILVDELYVKQIK